MLSICCNSNFTSNKVRLREVGWPGLCCCVQCCASKKSRLKFWAIIQGKRRIFAFLCWQPNPSRYFCVYEKELRRLQSNLCWVRMFLAWVSKRYSFFKSTFYENFDALWREISITLSYFALLCLTLSYFWLVLLCLILSYLTAWLLDF